MVLSGCPDNLLAHEKVPTDPGPSEGQGDRSNGPRAQGRDEITQSMPPDVSNHYRHQQARRDERPDR